MSDVLVRIKRAILSGNFSFGEKALIEMDVDGINEFDVIESIVNASEIQKTVRSTSLMRKHRREYLYVIESPNLEGLMIYSKGKFTNEFGKEKYYFRISSKKAL
jgi:hypothetical protein